MATVSQWTPFGVALDLTATGGSVVRTSATQFTVVINASWKTHWSGAQTNYGMTVSSGGVTKTISAFNGTKRSSGSTSFTGTYSISGNGAATKTVSVTFRNFNTDNDDAATKSVSFNVSVPAWTSYQVKYNANGGTGAPSAQTKWKNQTLTLSKVTPSRAGYKFREWNTLSNGAGGTFMPGGSYTANASVTLYAQWTANTYQVKYNANGGSGAPATQTKTYGTTLTLSTTKPTRANYTFLGWSTSATATYATYQPGGSYTSNAAVTLYAIWEKTYVQPEITNLKVVRCSSDGELSDSGSYARVSFDWKTTYEKPSVHINCDPSDLVEPEFSEVSINLTGMSGTFNVFIEDHTFDDETSYTFRITLSDDGGESEVSAILPSKTFAIDLLAGGDGVAFGKTAELEGYMDVNYKTKFRKPVDAFTMPNNDRISGLRPTTADVAAGQPCEAFQPQNEYGNTIVGYGNYDNQSGNTNIYGYDVTIGISNVANPNTYRPYRRRGDSFTVEIRTSGYVTNGKQHVHFRIPMSEPIIGSPTITAASVTGFTFRQGELYTHGTSSSTSVKADSIEATYSMLNGIEIKAVFSDTTNATNNDAIGIYWKGTITLS